MAASGSSSSSPKFGSGADAADSAVMKPPPEPKRWTAAEAQFEEEQVDSARKVMSAVVPLRSEVKFIPSSCAPVRLPVRVVKKFRPPAEELLSTV